MLTEQCTVLCRHCWFESGPKKSDTMTILEAENYIHQANEFSTLEWISFTGGEPFLLPDMLVKLVTHVSSLGLKTECVTNGFWAKTEQIARTQLRRLKSAGLDVINLSVDDYHQEFISINNIRHCFNAAKYLDLNVVIMCVLSKSSKLHAKTIIEHLGDDTIYVPQTDSDRTRLDGITTILVESGFLPAGRASNLIAEHVPDPNLSITGGCPFILRDIVITPGGRVLPCCSAGALTNPLAVGNINTQPLSTIIEEANKHHLIKFLVKYGPHELFRQMGPFNISNEVKYTSKCHLCYEILSKHRLNKLISGI